MSPFRSRDLSRTRSVGASPGPLSAVLAVIPAAVTALVSVFIVLPLFLFVPLPLLLALLLPLLLRFPVIPVPTGAFLLPLAVRDMPLPLVPRPVVTRHVDHRPGHPVPRDHPPPPVVRPRTVPPVTARPPPEPPL